jgi:hypothetical protein
MRAASLLAKLSDPGGEPASTETAAPLTAEDLEFLDNFYERETQRRAARKEEEL